MINQEINQFHIYKSHNSNPITFKSRTYGSDVDVLKSLVSECGYCGEKIYSPEKIESHLSYLLSLKPNEFQKKLNEIARLYPPVQGEILTIISAIPLKATSESQTPYQSNTLKVELARKKDLISYKKNQLEQIKVKQNLLEEIQKKSVIIDDFTTRLNATKSENSKINKSLAEIKTFIEDYKQINSINIQKRYDFATNFAINNLDLFTAPESLDILCIPDAQVNQMIQEFYSINSSNQGKENLLKTKNRLETENTVLLNKNAQKIKYDRVHVELQNITESYRKTNAKLQFIEGIISAAENNKTSMPEKLVKVTNILHNIPAKYEYMRLLKIMTPDGKEKTVQFHKIESEEDLHIFTSNMKKYRKKLLSRKNNLNSVLRRYQSLVPKNADNISIVSNNKIIEFNNRKIAEITKKIANLDKNIIKRFGKTKSINTFIIKFIDLLTNKSDLLKEQRAKNNEIIREIANNKVFQTEKIAYERLINKFSKADAEKIKSGKINNLLRDTSNELQEIQKGLSLSDMDIEVMKSRYEQSRAEVVEDIIRKAIFATSEKQQSGQTLTKAETFILGYRDYRPSDLLKAVLSTRMKTFDHVKTYESGGKNTFDNGIISCSHCNGLRSKRPLWEFLNENKERKSHLKTYIRKLKGEMILEKEYIHELTRRFDFNLSF